MKLVRNVIVFDAAELTAESSFWAGIFGGYVFEDEAWHSVVDADGEWRIGVQLAPNHVPPEWPHGVPQQVHLDLHVDDPRAAHEEAISSAPACSSRLLTWTVTKAIRCTPTRPDTRSASAGGTRPKRRSPRSSPTGSDEGTTPGQPGSTGLGTTPLEGFFYDAAAPRPAVTGQASVRVQRGAGRRTGTA